MDDAHIESELKGKTLLVYMHILKAGQETVGVREVQRTLGFSSPSVAAYHLQKLQDLGLIENAYGDYRLIKEVKVGVLRSFVSVGGVMLPRFLFYAVLVTSMLVTFLVQFPFVPTASTSPPSSWASSPPSSSGTRPSRYGGRSRVESF